MLVCVIAVLAREKIAVCISCKLYFEPKKNTKYVLYIFPLINLQNTKLQ